MTALIRLETNGKSWQHFVPKLPRQFLNSLDVCELYEFVSYIVVEYDKIVFQVHVTPGIYLLICWIWSNWSWSEGISISKFALSLCFVDWTWYDWILREAMLNLIQLNSRRRYILNLLTIEDSTWHIRALHGRLAFLHFASPPMSWTVLACLLQFHSFLKWDLARSNI